MLQSELADLINAVIKNESSENNIEIRRSKEDYTTNILYNSLSGFANTVNGGMILFGLEENNNITITGVDDIKQLKNDVLELSQQMYPIVEPVFTQITIQNKDVLLVEIAECSMYEKPCYYKGKGLLNGSFVWEDNINRHMTEYEIYRYKTYKESIYDDLREIDISISEIETEKLTECIESIKQKNTILNQKSDMYIMDKYGIIKNGKPTMAGLMLFSDYPQKYFPQLCICIAVAKKENTNEEDIFEKCILKKYKRIDGNIYTMLYNAVEYVKENSNVLNSDDKKSKIEYPVSTVYEVIFNALIHRDYSKYMQCKPVNILLYDDKIEIENPGCLYAAESVCRKNMMLEEKRNPYLLKLVEVIGEEHENRFGMVRTFRELHKRGLHPPIFENKHNYFKVIMYKKLVFCDKIPEHKGGKTDDNIKQMILILCKEPKSREELAKVLGLDSQYYMVTRYLRPLIEKGVLKMTLPNTPKSKNQRYYTE